MVVDVEEALRNLLMRVLQVEGSEPLASFVKRIYTKTAHYGPDVTAHKGVHVSNEVSPLLSIVQRIPLLR